MVGGPFSKTVFQREDNAISFFYRHNMIVYQLFLLGLPHVHTYNMIVPPVLRTSSTLCKYIWFILYLV